ncbi:hypothetical protein WBK50_09525 [Pseudonocardia sp. T1-2H]|uniref:hypothetical protein n=1 Tax=Pseudonocardia sp. T1-2H TaxID=3128899 RepID=UPI003101048D
MQDDRHVRVLDVLPERVELRERRRAPAAVPLDRRRLDEHGPGTVLDEVLEFPAGVVDQRTRDHRGHEEPVLVHVAPRLEHPAVERVDHRHDQLGVLRRGVLDQVGQRREDQRLVHALLVEGLDPGARLAEVRLRVDRPTGELAEGLPLLVLARIELLVRPQGGHPVERGVGDELGDPVEDRDTGVPSHLHVLHRPAEALRQVPGEGLRCLVHVGVRVEDRRVGVLRHCSSLHCRDVGATSITV